MKLPELSAASYNGVTFSVPSSSRNTQHALVQYHSPYAQHSLKDDLGLASENISMEAFVSGYDAYKKAASLRKELDKQGEGTLLHPSYGKLKVLVQSVEESQDFVDGLFLVTFRLSFVRADERKSLGSVDAGADLPQQALALQNQFAGRAKQKMASVPQQAKLSLDQVRKELADINGQLQAVYRLCQLPYEFTNELLSIMDDLTNIALAPLEITAVVMDMASGIGEAILSVPNRMFKNLSRAIIRLKKSYDRLDQLASGQTSERYELQLQASVSQLVGLLVPASEAPYQSREQAKAIQQDLQVLLNKTKTKAEYGQYEKLLETEQAFHAAIASRMASLPEEKGLGKEQADEPLPVALHRLHGQNIALLPNPFFPSDQVLYV